MSDTSSLQQRVASFVAENHLETDVAHRLLDATSELGELAKEILKATRYGRQPFSPTTNWDEELGDVFFSLICVANLSGSDVDALVTRALAKYEKRLAAAGSAGSA